MMTSSLRPRRKISISPLRTVKKLAVDGVGQRGTRRLIKGVNRFPYQENPRQQHKRKAEERYSPPDSRKRGKQALIEKVRSERQMALEKTGVTLLPGTSLLPRKEVVDVEEDETDTEEGMEEANSDAERPEGTASTAH